MSEPSLDEEDYLFYEPEDEDNEVFEKADLEKDEEPWPEIGQFYTPKGYGEPHGY